MAARQATRGALPERPKGRCGRGLRLGWMLAVTIAGACALPRPPERPDPSLLGCYRLAPNLSEVYADSLTYDLPDVIRLAFWSGSQWVVLPTGFEHHPWWTHYDGLPSTLRPRLRQEDPPYVLPGDSIDVVFPGPLGRLVLRMGRRDGGLGGRAAWRIFEPDVDFPALGVAVHMTPTGCDALPASLERRKGAHGARAGDGEPG